MKRLNQNVDQVQWFDFPGHYVFHFSNSWEETNDLGETVVKLYGCSYDMIDAEFKEEHPFWYNEDKDELRGKFTKFEFNLKTGKSSRKVLIEPGYSTEFPTINVNYTGYKSRYCYMSFSSKVVPKEQEGQDNMQFVGFIKFDLETEKIVSTVNLGEYETTGEVFF